MISLLMASLEDLNSKNYVQKKNLNTFEKLKTWFEMWGLNKQTAGCCIYYYLYHEQLCEWSFQSSGSLQQTCNHLQPGSTELCLTPSARRIGQRCSLWGNPGCHQIHLSQVNGLFPVWEDNTQSTALLKATHIFTIVFISTQLFMRFSCYI